MVSFGRFAHRLTHSAKASSYPHTHNGKAVVDMWITSPVPVDKSMDNSDKSFFNIFFFFSNSVQAFGSQLCLYPRWLRWGSCSLGALSLGVILTLTVHRNCQSEALCRYAHRSHVARDWVTDNCPNCVDYGIAHRSDTVHAPLIPLQTTRLH